VPLADHTERVPARGVSQPRHYDDSDVLDGASEETLPVPWRIHLRATRPSGLAPSAKVFAVVLEKVVALFANAGASATYDVARARLAEGVSQSHRDEVGE
jgi:hypothetical protein